MSLLPTQPLLHFNHINEIPNKLYKELLKLNLQSEGYMQELYEEIFKHRSLCPLDLKSKNHHIVIYVDVETNKVVSHGLLIQRVKHYGEMHVWTSIEYRGKGFGRKTTIEILKHAYIKRFRKVRCFKTDYGANLWLGTRRHLKEIDKGHLAELIHIKRHVV